MEESSLSEMIPIERPLPYYITNYNFCEPADTSIPLTELGTSTVNVEPSESESIMEAILGDHGKLKFRAMGKLAFREFCPLVVHIRDKQDQILMSSAWTTTVRQCEEIGKSEKFTTFTDSNGKHLLTSKENKGNLVVTSDRLVGIISRQGPYSSSKLRVQNDVGEEVFTTVRESNNSFRFLAKDSVIATAKNTKHSSTISANIFTMKFSPSLDLNTKILLIVAANYLNTRFFVDCVGGSSGTAGLRRQKICIYLIGVILGGIFGCLLIYGIIELILYIGNPK